VKYLTPAESKVKIILSKNRSNAAEYVVVEINTHLLVVAPFGEELNFQREHMPFVKKGFIRFGQGDSPAMMLHGKSFTFFSDFKKVFSRTEYNMNEDFYFANIASRFENEPILSALGKFSDLATQKQCNVFCDIPMHIESEHQQIPRLLERIGLSNLYWQYEQLFDGLHLYTLDPKKYAECYNLYLRQLEVVEIQRASSYGAL